MAGGVDFLTAEMAQKAHIDAVNRDYVCEPHLGERTWGRCCAIVKVQKAAWMDVRIAIADGRSCTPHTQPLHVHRRLP